MRRVGNASWEFEPGHEIAPGRTVLKSIGGGNLYEVHLVWDEHMHSILVAKVVRPDQADDDRAREGVAEEAEVLASLAHPVIVRGYGAVTAGPYPHLLIEHLEGPSLRRLIKRGGPLPLQQLLPLALNLSGALHYMAEEGWVHLDVKPDNTIMGVPPRLIDLSIARPVERAARVRKPIGTDAYMPPEQCDPSGYEGEIGPPADVWGLGATLFHAAAGARPFPRQKTDRDSEDPEVRFPQLVRAPVELPDRVPAEMRALIGEMLVPDPADRPTAAGVAARLEPLIAELPAKLTLSRRGRTIA
jgi:serine/threonine protein kinase